jgi:hypothetical protein
MQVIEQFQEGSSVVIPSKRLSVSLNRSRTSFKYTSSLAPVCWPLTYHPELAFETGKAQAINIIESVL